MLKDIIIGKILKPYIKVALGEVNLKNTLFYYFINNNIRGLRTFKGLFKFLYNYYFLRLI